MATQSILISTKKQLGITADDHAFDLDIIMHINSALGTLNDLGIGPAAGYEIEDDEATWEAFLLGDARLNPAKTYVYLKVRLIFDPPAIASVASAYGEMIKELEWRLNVIRENAGVTSTGSTALPTYPTTPGTPATNTASQFDHAIFSNTTFNGGIIDGGSP
jgi:hypothetical protein